MGVTFFTPLWMSSNRRGRSELGKGHEHLPRNLESLEEPLSYNSSYNDSDNASRDEGIRLATRLISKRCV